MAEREHDVASSLIAALADEAVHVDDGSFTLDPAAAFTKLRSHQLDDPHRYVLLLVEAAWLAAEDLDNAELRVELGAGSLAGSVSVFDIHGIPLQRGSLQHLFTAALGGTGKLRDDALRRARVLQLLGLAANNALALRPKRLILEASDAHGHRERLCIDPDGTLTVEPAKPSAPGWVRFMFCASVFANERPLIERALLDRLCRYTRLAIRVDHHLISQRTDVDVGRGIDAHTGKPIAAPIMLDGRAIGVIGPHRNPYASTSTWIVSRGVAFADPTSATRGLQAVVELDLPLDLSRKQLLQGPELEAVRAAIHDARARVAEPVTPLQAPSQPAPPFPAEELFRKLLVFVVIAIVIGIVGAILDSLG